jgi:ABC-type antimicrobial peptide transport system permease subunit
MAFLPLLQIKSRDQGTPGEFESNFINAIEVRSIGNPSTVAAQARQVLADIDPGLLILGVDTVSEQISSALNQENVIADLAGFFGLLAAALACAGIYGLLSYMIQRRAGEIGIRMALGANRSAVVRMVIRQALVQGVAGILIGIPAALATTHVVANQLFGVSPADPINSGTAALVMILCAAIAAFLPAHRASHIDPMTALRHD